MKLLHIVGDSEFSGSVIVPKLAQMTKQLGWQVDVLTTNQLHGPYRLYRFLRSAGYDIVHTHGSQANWVGLAARLAGTTAILHSAHGFAFDECSHPLALWLYTLPERLAARWSDRMIMMSDFHRRWALRLGIGDQRKVISIPNGIPNRRPWAERERLDARSGLGAGPDQVVLLVTGRLAADSGVEYLIDAMPALAARLDRPFLVLVAGDGPSRASLERRARDRGVADRFSFLGFRKDIDDLLAASDLVLFTGLRAGPSIALLEAMAAAKPIIATSVGSNREVTRNDEAALLVPPADSAALTDAICTLSSDPQRAARLARRARQIFFASYTDTLTRGRYLNEYFRLVEETLRCATGQGKQPVWSNVAHAIERAATRLVSTPVCASCGERRQPDGTARQAATRSDTEPRLVARQSSSGSMNQHECSHTGPLDNCRATSRGSVSAAMRRIVSQARIFAARKEAHFSGTAIPVCVAVKTEHNRAPVIPLDAEEK